MKLIAIYGGPRKGNTYNVLNTIKDSFPDINFRILMLQNLNLELLGGCYSCVVRGEDKCPIKDDRDMILNEITGAAGVNFASPAYCRMVKALMKTSSTGSDTWLTAHNSSISILFL